MELATLRSMLATSPYGRPQRGAWTLSEDAQRRGWMAIRGLQRSWSTDLAAPRSSQKLIPVVGARGRFRFVEATKPAVSGGQRSEIAPARVATVNDDPRASQAVADQTTSPRAGAIDPHRNQSAACAELFVCEPVIRLWCLLLVEYAESRDCDSARQFARNLIVAQYQTRQLALAAVMATPDSPGHAPSSTSAGPRKVPLDPTSGASLDRLRRIGERWTDLLLANRLAHPRTADLVFDHDRADEFAEQLALLPSSPQPAAAWELALVSVRTVYPAFPWAEAPRAQLARGLAEALLATFPPEAFTSSGTWLPSWVSSWKRYGIVAR
jgi:hypothetical protein